MTVYGGGGAELAVELASHADIYIGAGDAMSYLYLRRAGLRYTLHDRHGYRLRQAVNQLGRALTVGVTTLLLDINVLSGNERQMERNDDGAPCRNRHGIRIRHIPGKGLNGRSHLRSRDLN